jgi:hypothetical protein
MKVRCAHPEDYDWTGEVYREVVPCGACEGKHELALGEYKCRTCGSVCRPDELITFLDFVDGPDPGPHWVPKLQEVASVSYRFRGEIVVYSVRRVMGVLKGCYSPEEGSRLLRKAMISERPSPN